MRNNNVRPSLIRNVEKYFLFFLRYSGFNVRIVSCINILFNLVVLYSPEDGQ